MTTRLIATVFLLGLSSATFSSGMKEVCFKNSMKTKVKSFPARVQGLFNKFLPSSNICFEIDNTGVNPTLKAVDPKSGKEYFGFEMAIDSKFGLYTRKISENLKKGYFGSAQARNCRRKNICHFSASLINIEKSGSQRYEDDNYRGGSFDSQYEATGELGVYFSYNKEANEITKVSGSFIKTTGYRNNFRRGFIPFNERYLDLKKN